MATPNAPAGWYSDPGGSPLQRWWNGKTWTDSTRPYPPHNSDSSSLKLSQTVGPPVLKRSFGTVYRETWVRTGAVMGVLTTIAIAGGGYDFTSDLDTFAFLIDGAFAFIIGFLTWGSLINLIVAAVRFLK
jgi:hypothetical protein